MEKPFVFRSPRRLNLRLVCTPETPAKDTLDIWPPAFPLIVWGGDIKSSSAGTTDNTIAALEQRNRVSQVHLFHLSSWQLENVLATMQVPFPELEYLRLTSADDDHETPPPVIPDSLLGGSAPHLRFFSLSRISFPGLPKLLLTCSRLVSLLLFNIPHSGYISPEAIVALFSVLSSLEDLRLSFQSPRSHPGGRLWSVTQSPKRSILRVPALRVFHFKGVTEYLEELVSRIGTPQLNQMNITFFNQIDFNTPRLAQFINCTPSLRALNEAHVYVCAPDTAARIRFQYRASEYSFEYLSINISCIEPDWQLSSIEQICNSLHSLSTVEDLSIERLPAGYNPLVWKDDPLENILWLQLLLPFTAVKNLYLSVEHAPRIAATLKEQLVTSRVAEILPSLQNIFVAGLDRSGPLWENIEHFVAARQFSDNPIAISDWDGRRRR